MKPFTYERPATPLEAARAGAREGAKFIAGGTNLLDLMKLQVETPTHLVDVSRLGLDKVETMPNGGLRIGTLVRNADLAAHPKVRQDYPVLARALLAGASGQLRNMATTGGNLLQRTRCYYFYDPTKPCNKRQPGSGCSALQGFNRIHAIVGGSEQCIAVHPSDMAVAMRVLDATVEVLAGDGSSRTIPVADLHRLPEATPQRETTLAAGELIIAVTLPPPAGGVQTYRKVRDRASFAFGLVSVAAVFQKEGGRLRAGRVAMGGIAPRPWRADAADRAFADATSGDAAADILLEGAKGHGHNDFKIPLARRTLNAVVAEALQS